MLMSIKISVIIPVYNAENYIKYCIESLLNQTLKECEFIFVNDGSHDQSRSIIEKYQQIDDRIILINQENEGVSTARNIGIKLAVGEYIGFVDADDYIESEMYEELYNSAIQNDCEIAISNFESEIDRHKVITKYPFPSGVILNSKFIHEKLLPYFIVKDDLNTACSKIYISSLIKENSIEFPEKVALGEDGMFNIQSFSHATTIIYIDYTGYHYRETAGSATRDILHKDYFRRAIEVYYSALPDIFLSIIELDRVQKQKAIRLLNSVISYIHIYFNTTKDLSFKSRFNYVRNMIRNKEVIDVIPIFYSEKYKTLGKYDKVLLQLIKKQSAIGLYLLTSYSRLRNK
jgi:glycosyltransferase involved in cell wall biosynthesis